MSGMEDGVGDISSDEECLCTAIQVVESKFSRFSSVPQGNSLKRDNSHADGATLLESHNKKSRQNKRLRSAPTRRSFSIALINVKSTGKSSEVKFSLTQLSLLTSRGTKSTT